MLKTKGRHHRPVLEQEHQQEAGHLARKDHTARLSTSW